MAKKKNGKFTLGNFKLKTKRSRTGLGLFAEEAIPKGACIIEYVGKKIPKRLHESTTGKYLFWTSDTTMIDGNIPRNRARYINHSCKPNCEADGPNGKVFILSLRTIKAGEELTYDYGEEYFEDHFSKNRCRCQACKPQ